MPSYDVSLVVTVRDQAPLLRDALTSLTRQFEDPSRLQVLLVDDGSVDDPAAVAAEYAPALPGLTVLRHEQPRGLSEARNTGLAAAQGRTLGFMDGDDWFAPGHLASLLHSLDTLGVDFVRTDLIEEHAGTRKPRRAPHGLRSVPLVPRDTILPATRTTLIDYPYAWAGLFHRRVHEELDLVRFRDGLHTAEDRPWIWRLFLGTSSLAVVDSPGILYRRGGGGTLTQILDERQLQFTRAFALAIEAVAADREAERFLPKVARQLLGVSAHQLERSRAMTPELRRRMRQSIGETSALLPAEVLREAFDEVDARRARVLRPWLALQGKAVSA